MQHPDISVESQSKTPKSVSSEKKFSKLGHRLVCKTPLQLYKDSITQNARKLRLGNTNNLQYSYLSVVLSYNILSWNSSVKVPSVLITYSRRVHHWQSLLKYHARRLLYMRGCVTDQIRKSQLSKNPAMNWIKVTTLWLRSRK